jgi:hypothetical protein
VRIRTRPVSQALASALFLLLSAAAFGDSTPERRIIAIGDIHGAIAPLRTILLETQLIDTKDRWIGGGAVLVQTGDFLDRGAGTFQVVELLRSLQEQAPDAGGEVIVLMGNHEALNLLRDMTYVGAELLAPWAGHRSRRARRRHCEEALDHAERVAALESVKPPEPTPFHQRCLEQTPPGLLEYLADLEPDGNLGVWLRSLPAVVRVDGLLFVHGGLTEVTAALPEAEINMRVAQEVAAFDRVRTWLVSRRMLLSTAPATQVAAAALQVLEALEGGAQLERPPQTDDLRAFRQLESWFLVNPEGPLWFRGYATWSDEEGAPRIDAILRTAGVRAAIAGHTPRSSAAIEERWNRKVFLIDTGMLASHYGGRPSALEFSGGEVRAVYPAVKQIFGKRP